MGILVERGPRGDDDTDSDRRLEVDLEERTTYGRSYLRGVTSPGREGEELHVRRRGTLRTGDSPETDTGYGTPVGERALLVV